MDQTQLKSHKKILAEETGVVITKDLRQNLIQWHDAFVELRYLHEFTEKGKAQPKMKRTWVFLDQIVAAVRRTAIDIDPSWII